MSTATTFEPNGTVTTSPHAGRGWGLAGAAAGVLGVVGLFATAEATAVDEALYADNAAFLAEIAGRGAYVWAAQIVTSLSALLLVVFGAGLRRRLAGQEPAGSLVPTVAFAGVLLVAALLLVGGGISTELYWALGAGVGETDPDTVAANAGIFNTMAWVWAGIGLTAGAVGVAGLRRGSVSRWLAWFSLVMAGLIGFTQAVPLQYMALLPAGLWCLVAGLGLAASAHPRRR